MILISYPMNTTYKIRSIGGSLMVVLPQEICRSVGLKAGDKVAYVVSERGSLIAIRPTRKAKEKK